MPRANTSPDKSGTARADADAAPRVCVFVGVKAAPEIARELARLAADLENPPFRPVAPSDIHLTLVPPWEEASIPDAIEKLRVVESFALWPAGLVLSG